MPLIDVLRQAAEPLVEGADRVITDLDARALAMIDPGPQMMRKHLGPETDAEEWLVFSQRNADPLDFLPHVFVGIVGALRATKDHGAAVVAERLGQRIVVAGTPNIECMPVSAEPLADVARVGMSLMQDDEHGFLDGHRRRPGPRQRLAAWDFLGAARFKHSSSPAFRATTTS